VLGSWSGWFGNVNYGVTVGGAYELGAAVSTGGSFYRSGAIELDPPLFSYTPLGADSHTVPGQQQPDQLVPGLPGTRDVLDLGEILFRTQQSDPEAAAGGPGALDHAVELVRGQPQRRPGSRVIGVSVVGEASRRFRHPRPGKTPVEENAQLASDRAEHVKASLDGRLHGDPAVNAHGAGDRRPAKEGKAQDDGTPGDQRALMFGDVDIPATSDKVVPGEKAPDRQEKDKMDVKIGVPNPFTTERTAWGWDTTAGVAGLAGAGVKAGGYLGAGVSYSFPIGKSHFQHDTMEKIRVAAGVVKILADIISLSPLGLLRDIIALSRGGAAPDAQTTMTSAVTSWSLPAPPVA
jgi:hypothetical protein